MKGEKPAALTVQDVDHLAQLARIELTPDEKQRFAGQLEEILAHVEQLKKAQTGGAAPTSHVLPMANVFREDRTAPSLSTDEALSNAPDREGPFFRVPRIIDPAV